MTAQTIGSADASVFARPASPARLRRILTWFRNLSVQLELDPHLAADVGQRTYDAPILPQSWTKTSKTPAQRYVAMARQEDAPVLSTSWKQVSEKAGSRPGQMKRVVAIISAQRSPLAANPLDLMDRHIARDIGVELEAVRFRHLQAGGSRYV